MRLKPPAADELDAAIREASTYLNGRVQPGSKAVFLNINSPYPDLSEYILGVLSENAVNDGVFSVVDRQSLDVIRAELNFQYSGDVSDQSAQAIGQMLGAQAIVSGTVSKIGALYRLQVKAIEVQTAAVQGQWSKNVPDGVTIAALTQNTTPAGRPATAQGGAQATPAQASNQAQPAASTPAPTEPIQNGIYMVRPRIRAHQAGVNYDLWIDRVMVRGNFYTVYFTGSAVGKGGDGKFGPFWDNDRNVLLTDLDRPNRTYSPIAQGEDDETSNAISTMGFFLTFQGANPRRFSLTSTSRNPPIEFDQIVLGEPE